MSELIDKNLYFRKDLSAHLKSKGLPFTKNTILKYERLGIIPSPRSHVSTMKKGRKRWRVYTGAEIKEIAKILRYKIKGK